MQGPHWVNSTHSAPALYHACCKLCILFFFFFPISAVNDGSSDHKRLLLAALEKGFIGCAFFFFQQINANTKIMAQALKDR